MTALERLYNAAVVPVVVLDDAADAVPTAKALLAGGVDVMEITFRTAAAADSIKAVSEGCRSFTRLAVVGNSTDYCWPCGSCRQMLYEFSPDLTVLVARRDHSFVSYPLRELLPHGFGPADPGSGDGIPERAARERA